MEIFTVLESNDILNQAKVMALIKNLQDVGIKKEIHILCKEPNPQVGGCIAVPQHIHPKYLKLYLWSFIQYKRVLFIQPGLLLLQDFLPQLERFTETFHAAPMYDAPDIFSSSVMLLTPCTKTFNFLLWRYSRHLGCMTDADLFLNEAFLQWETNMDLRLSTSFNMPLPVCRIKPAYWRQKVEKEGIFIINFQKMDPNETLVTDTPDITFFKKKYLSLLNLE